MAYALNRLFNGFLLWSANAAVLLAWLTVATTSICTATRSWAYVGAMKSDLRVLSEPRTRAMFRPSFGVHVTIERDDVHQWRARATHDRLPGAVCTLERGAEWATCEIPMSWADKHLTRENVFNVSVEYWLVALTWRRQRRRAASATT